MNKIWIGLIVLIALVIGLHFAAPYLIGLAYTLDPIGWGDNNILAKLLIEIGNFFS